MFEQIQSRLDKVFTTLRGKGKISEDNIDSSLREVRRALLEADVNYKVVKSFIERVKSKATGEKVYKSVTPGQQFIKIIKDELIIFLGSNAETITFSKKIPKVILIAGLQGSGKTTTSVKLALYIKKNFKKKPILIAADLQRPAAIEQLNILAKSCDIDVYSNVNEKNPLSVVEDGLNHSKTNGNDVVIIDTAGRLHVDEKLMIEVKQISNISNPDETYYVADSMTGQDAVNSATEFNKILKISGVILTKLDGDTRGGAALSLREVTGKPIKFIGTGESIKAFELFHPERMASRILGMGDIVSLVEKAQKTFDKDVAMSSMERLKAGIFTFKDYKNQINQIKKLGPLSNVMSMIPGMSKVKNINFDENNLKWTEAIINSMTEFERENPDKINASRRARIARGSGKNVQDVNRLIKQYNQMKIMLKKMKNKKNMKLPFNFS
tara:strand:+ start:5785 stop:7104 length:1320 start_codon:yes stop_codon:yes gene_type:complete